ncbi:MAG: PAC2 family protein [Dehalococcoidia bacterium]
MVHESVRILEDRALRNPIVIAGFASQSGTTAAAVIDHIVERWGGTAFAEVDAEEYFDFTVRRPFVQLEGEHRVLQWPVSRLYVASPEALDRDIVLLSGVEPSLRWRSFSEAVASLLAEIGATTFVTVAAYPGAVPHTRPLPVRLDGADTEFTRPFGIEPTASAYEGPVGITSVISLALQARGIETVSLTALTPFYAVADPHPHATTALVEALDRGLGTSTALGEVRDRALQLDGDVATAIEESPQLRTVVTTLEEQYDWMHGTKTALLGAPAEAALVLPSGEEAILDVERFLEEQRGGTSAADGPPFA